MAKFNKGMLKSRTNRHASRTTAALGLLLVLLVAQSFAGRAAHGQAASAQDAFPAPPADQTLIYVADKGNALAPLPFERGATPLRADAVAGSDKRSYVELKGDRAATVIANDVPRFYLFVPDQSGVHPPFLVRLTERRGARRVTAMAQKNLRGFAVASEEIVKPHYRVLARDGGMLFMEVRPRLSLLPGEYAIIGTDLARVATFRIQPTSNP